MILTIQLTVTPLAGQLQRGELLHTDSDDLTFLLSEVDQAIRDALHVGAEPDEGDELSFTELRLVDVVE